MIFVEDPDSLKRAVVLHVESVAGDTCDAATRGQKLLKLERTERVAGGINASNQSTGCFQALRSQWTYRQATGLVRPKPADHP